MNIKKLITSGAVWSALIVAFGMSITVQEVHAEDLALCPDGFEQGIVTTGSVECYDESRRESRRSDAEMDRVELEAVCNNTPNGAVTSSAVLGTPSGGFFAAVTCTITRATPAGTVFCPDDAEEVYRAFDTLVCQYFGSAVATVQQAQTSLNEQTTACTTGISGQVFESEIFMDELSDETPYFYSTLACGLDTVATNTIECPFSYTEFDRDENEIECNLNRRDYETEAEARQANTAAQSLCTDTTAGLGRVTDFQVSMTSIETFFSNVDCTVRIPRYSDFSDQTVLRACDATCTEDIRQARTCLNGGQIGGPGCIEASTQDITRNCNTGPVQNTACPLALAPFTVTPLLLLDEEEEEEED